MNAPLYTTEILRLAASLTEPRTLEREDGVAELRSPTCGSRVKTAVTVNSEGSVASLSQYVHACAFGQASATIVERGAVGLGAGEIDTAIRAMTAWLAGTGDAPDWPGVLALAPARSRSGRHGAILLPFRTLAAALAEAAVRRGQGNLPAP